MVLQCQDFNAKTSIRQLEYDVYDCAGIHRLTVPKSGLEAHLVRRCDGRFIQPMTHASDHATHVQLSVGPKHDFQENFSLELQIASFIRVNRIRFESDFDRVRRRTGIGEL
jgi:hypothetical protein